MFYNFDYADVLMLVLAVMFTLPAAQLVSAGTASIFVGL